MYRFPNQSTSEFEFFLSSLEDLLSIILCSKSQFTIILDDFNPRLSEWWSKDNATLHATQIDFLTTTYGFKVLISDTTHILLQPLPCIDLILTDQTNYLTDWYTFLFTS